MYEGQVSGVSYKDSSSFALFDGKPSTEAVKYQSSPRFLLIDSEKDFICHLRRLFDGVQFSSGTPSSSSEFCYVLIVYICAFGGVLANERDRFVSLIWIHGIASSVIVHFDTE